MAGLNGLSKEELRIQIAKLDEKNRQLQALLKKEIAARTQPAINDKLPEELLNQLRNSGNDGFCFFDNNHIIGEVNQKLASMLGYEVDEIIGKNIDEFLFVEDITEKVSKKNQAIKFKCGFRECRFKLRDETTLQTVVSVSNQFYNEIDQPGFLMVAFNFTTNEAITVAAENDITQHGFLLDSLPVALYTTEGDGADCKRFFAGDVERITGYKATIMSLSHNFWQNNLHPDDRDRVLNYYHIKRQDTEVAIEYRWKCADGNYKLFYDRNILVDSNSHQEFLGAMVDITDLKLPEKETHLIDKSYMGLFNTVSDAVYIHKEDGVFIDVNESAVKMYGYEREELIGMTPEMVAAPGKNNLTMVMDLMKLVMLTGEPQHLEFWAMRKNGEIFLKDIILNKGKYHGEDVIVTTARDITERKLTDEKIRQQNENLERINAEKDKFFSIIAHDLRSPFNGFLGLTEIMADKLMLMSVNEIQRHASIMKGAANNLYRLLENLLEWSRNQKGITVYKPEVFALSKLINESIRTSVDQASLKDIDVEVNVYDKMFVYADIHMVETICRNLTSNAVKYTPRGGSIRVTSELSDSNFVAISVTDTGIGMDQEIIDGLFAVEHSSKRNGTEGEPSSGLGLLLCKDFIEKNRGLLTVQSNPGEGSTFTFTLPLFFSKKIEEESVNLRADSNKIIQS
jgi:PAS domain S-box-containing protein